MQATVPEAPSEVFSLLHDGVVVAHSWTAHTLTLTVNILYLAERLNPTYRALDIHLTGVSNVAFRTWPKDESPPKTLTNRADLEALFAAEPDILSGSWNAETNRTTVVLNQSEPSLDYCGGDLSFESQAITITDPLGKTRSISDLVQAARAYWDDFGNRAKR